MMSCLVAARKEMQSSSEIKNEMRWGRRNRDRSFLECAEGKKTSCYSLPQLGCRATGWKGPIRTSGSSAGMETRFRTSPCEIFITAMVWGGTSGFWALPGRCSQRLCAAGLPGALMAPAEQLGRETRPAY